MPTASRAEDGDDRDESRTASSKIEPNRTLMVAPVVLEWVVSQ